MTVGDLEFGDSMSGLLIDGVDGTPYVGAALRMTKDRGVVIEVPYLPSNAAEQFDHVRAWFDSRTPPTNMIMLTPMGTISLFDITWSGHSENWGGRRASVGTLRPDLTVLGYRDGDLSAALVMNEMHSWMDGLNDWSDASAVETGHELDDESRVKWVTMRLETEEELSWRQGNATMSLRAGWQHQPVRDGYDRRTIVHDNVALVSVFDEGPASFRDHFVEHRKVANLMVFLFNRPIAFRKHRLRDDSFNLRLGGGRIMSYPLTHLVSRDTYREQIVEVPSGKDLGRPLAYAAEIGASGLETWASEYDTWHRFIAPSCGVLGRTNAFIEDIIVSTSMSMEAAGGIIGKQPDEDPTWSPRRRPTTATYVYRCLYALDVVWPARVNDRVGLARAIANMYNDVKHYDRGDFPGHEESYVVSEISEWIVRLLAITITGRGDEILSPYRESDQFFALKQALDGYGMRVDKDGSWARDSDEKSSQQAMHNASASAGGSDARPPALEQASDQKIDSRSGPPSGSEHDPGALGPNPSS